jgi:hypothetical protein
MSDTYKQPFQIIDAERESEPGATPDPLPDDVPEYLTGAPVWFTAWRRHEFLPFVKATTRKLRLQDVALTVGKYAGVSAVTAAAAKWPEVGPYLKSVLDFLLAFGGQ